MVSPSRKKTVLRFAEVLFIDFGGSVERLEHVQAVLKKCATFAAAKRGHKLICAALEDSLAVAFLDMPSAAAHCALEFQGKEGAPKVRMALNSGALQPVEDPSGKPTLVGELIDIGNRALEESVPGEIYATGAAAEHLENLTEWRDRLEPLDRSFARHDRVIHLFRLVSDKEFEEMWDPTTKIGQEFARAKKLLEKAAARQAKSIGGRTEALACVSTIVERREEIRKGWVSGLAIIAILTPVGIWIGKTSLGGQFNLWAYSVIQQFVPGPTGKMPIAVVDVSQIPTIVDPRSRYNWTDREKLAQVIDEIQRMKPAAMAFDIDLGEQADGPGPGADELYETANKYKNVFLGVDWALSLPRDEWLEGEENAHLAIHAGLPHDIRMGMTAMEFTSKHDQIPSMAFALAHAYRGKFEKTPWFGQKFLDVEGEQGIKTRTYYLNYSVIDPLTKELDRPTAQPSVFLSIKKPEDLRGHGDLFDGRMVLVGDAEPNGPDVAPVPGRSGLVPGVFVQAAAAYTLSSSQPLFVFKWWVQTCMDILSGLVVLVGVQLIRLANITKRSEVSVRHADNFMTAALVTLVCGLAILWVRTYGILWLDFLVMSLTLAFHQWTDRWMDRFWNGLVAAVAALWRLAVYRRAGEEA